MTGSRVVTHDSPYADEAPWPESCTVCRNPEPGCHCSMWPSETESPAEGSILDGRSERPLALTTGA